MKELLRAKTEIAINDSSIKEEIIDDFDEDGEIREDVLEKLDDIESEMVKGKGIKFKSVDELAERYGL